MWQLNLLHRLRIVKAERALQFVGYIVCGYNVPQLILITNFNRVSCCHAQRLANARVPALSEKRDACCFGLFARTPLQK